MHLTNFHFYPYKNYLDDKPVKGLQGFGVGYGFSFNGKERDNETYGEGNAYDFGARIYDPRLGRWLAVDPLSAKYPYASPYNFVLNSPLIAIDEDGEDVIILISKDGAGGKGHMAMLIQNGDGTWFYVTQGAATDSRGSLAVSGMFVGAFNAALVVENLGFQDGDNALLFVTKMSEFKGSQNVFNQNAPITSSLKLTTSKEQDEKIYKQALKLQRVYQKGLKRYNILLQNCADAAQEIAGKGCGTLPLDVDPRPNKYFKKLERRLIKIQEKINKKIEKQKQKEAEKQKEKEEEVEKQKEEKTEEKK
jgi:RHS repeat-associated protein